MFVCIFYLFHHFPFQLFVYLFIYWTHSYPRLFLVFECMHVCMHVCICSFFFSYTTLLVILGIHHQKLVMGIFCRHGQTWQFRDFPDFSEKIIFEMIKWSASYTCFRFSEKHTISTHNHVCFRNLAWSLRTIAGKWLSQIQKPVTGMNLKNDKRIIN